MEREENLDNSILAHHHLQLHKLETGALTGTSPNNTVYATQIPKGTTVFTGSAGFQGGIHIEGVEQIFIPQPWTIPGVKVISSIPLK